MLPPRPQASKRCGGSRAGPRTFCRRCGRLCARAAPWARSAMCSARNSARTIHSASAPRRVANPRRLADVSRPARPGPRHVRAADRRGPAGTGQRGGARRARFARGRQATLAHARPPGGCACAPHAPGRRPRALPLPDALHRGARRPRAARRHGAPAGPPARRLGAGPAFVCIGGLTERKNVVRLARAFEALGRGSLAFLGDGPLRASLADRPGIRLAGAVPHDEIPRWLAAGDVVCQPSLVEPFGQALLEAMACARSVVATTNGGPPEFVTPEAGILVDPLDEAALAAALDAAARLPTPNDAARAAAAAHDVRIQAARLEQILARAARDRRAGSRRAA